MRRFIMSLVAVCLSVNIAAASHGAGCGARESQPRHACVAKRVCGPAYLRADHKVTGRSSR